jgi:SAM-dependent methyltransferase
MKKALQNSYRSPEAADEYSRRHRKTARRRRVTSREARIANRMLQGIGKGALIVDAACGTGRHAAFLHASGWEALGVDASAEMLGRGVADGTLRRAACGSIFHLPLSDGCAAGCVCMRFLHHLPDSAQRVAALKELRRVTLGPVVVTVWAQGNVQGLRRRIKGLFGRRPSARYTVRLEAFIEELEQAGFELMRIKHLYRFVSETVCLLLHPRE